MPLTDTISINGERYSLDSSNCLSDIITQTAFCAEKIAVAVNGSFIPRDRYNDTIIMPGDHIDIVKPIGGG